MSNLLSIKDKKLTRKINCNYFFPSFQGGKFPSVLHDVLPVRFLADHHQRPEPYQLLAGGGNCQGIDRNEDT